MTASGDGVFIVYFTQPQPIVIVFDIFVNSNGTFTVTGSAVESNDSRAGTSERVGYSLTGSISNGQLNGQLDGTTLSGAIDNNSSNGATTGYYQSSSNSASQSGSTYTVVGPDGQAFVAIVTNGTADSASGTVNSSGVLSATTTNGAALSETVNSQGVSATVTPSGSSPINFSGNTTNIAAPASRLVNLSVRGNVGTGANAMIAGFVTSGTGTKAVLIRGVGPTLSTFGITGALTAPQLTLVNSSGAVVASNTTWGGSSSLSNVFSQVGAFALPTSSADSAILQNIGIGPYSVELTGVGGQTGVALGELYDADVGIPTARFVNISARANVGSGPDVLIAGFVVSGNTNETVLLRGVGPTLSQFGLSGVLATPQITLYNSTGTAIATNAVWGGSASLSSTFAQVGAFTLPAGSADSVLLETLPPGAYTVEVSGVGGATGIALIEVYEVP